MNQNHSLAKPHKAGWYQRLFAFLLAKGNRHYERLVSDKKKRLLSDLHGTVVEIGPGTGANFPYYPKDLKLIAIEPNPYMHPYLQKKAEELELTVEIKNTTAEHLPLGDNSVDAAVSTLVLCSVADPALVLKEISRVLKPGGRFVFIEHVAASQGTGTRKVQNFIQPLWSLIADGCHPNRETLQIIREAEFENIEVEHFRVPYPMVGHQIAGTASKAKHES